MYRPRTLISATTFCWRHLGRRRKKPSTLPFASRGHFEVVSGPEWRFVNSLHLYSIVVFAAGDSTRANTCKLIMFRSFRPEAQRLRTTDEAPIHFVTTIGGASKCFKGLRKRLHFRCLRTLPNGSGRSNSVSYPFDHHLTLFY